MAAATQPVPPVGDAHVLRAPAPADQGVQSAIDATHANLDAYLNQPVQDIMARFGLGAPAAANAAAVGAPPPGGAPAGGPAPTGGAPGGGGSPMDPTQMIKPVTDALGTLGSGQYGDDDPTQSLGGISQALDSAGSQVQQALSGVSPDWQGDAASAAQAKTQDALSDGSKVSEQAEGLRQNLAAATAAVAQAQSRLLQIIDEYWAKIAAIGPSIIFPWGIAAAIAAATQAATETSEVMADTESTLTTQAAGATATGAKVDVADAPLLGSGTQALSPMMQLASTATSPIMQAIGSAAGSAGSSEAPSAASTLAAPAAAAGRTAAGAAGGLGHGGGGLGHAAGSAALAMPARSAGLAVSQGEAATAVPARSAVAATGAGAAPMGSGAGMAHPAGGKAGASGGHNAADFLHTSDQGGDIVGDLGNAAPPVIGEKDPTARPTAG